MKAYLLSALLIVEQPQLILGLVNCYSDFAVAKSLDQIMIAVSPVVVGENRELSHHY
jgi:hypothetical protein